MRWKSALVPGISLALSALCAGAAWSVTVPSMTEVLSIGAPATSARVTQDWQFVDCVDVVRRNTLAAGALPPANFSYPWYIQTSPQLQNQVPSLYPGGNSGPGGTAVIVPKIGGVDQQIPTPNCGADANALFYGEGTAAPAGGTAFTTSVVNRLRGAVVGNAALGTSAAGDSSVARDSLRLTVSVSGSTITLSNFVGQIRNTLGTLSPISTRTTMTLAVYPDTNVANADVTRSGVGANFFGKVVLTKTQSIDRLDLSGGFVAGDFTSTSNALENTATPKVGLSKTVAVPNTATVAIVLTGQPRVDIIRPEPGASPLGLGLISLLMLGGGVWVISRRYSRSLA
jgi:hypothetical protein